MTRHFEKLKPLDSAMSPRAPTQAPVGKGAWGGECDLRFLCYLDFGKNKDLSVSERGGCVIDISVSGVISFQEQESFRKVQLELV